MGPSYGARGLNLAIQAQALRTGWPDFKLVATPSRLIARGTMQPSSLSRSYAVRVEYALNENPKVFIESPTLARRSAAPDEEIPHTYNSKFVGKERPCTFFPPIDWDGTMKLAHTILPWLASWLVDYELWHATGAWSGGGISHSERIRDGKIKKFKRSL